MRLRLAGFVLLATATSATAQTALQLQWQLKDDVFQGAGQGSSRAAFTLTNRDQKPLAGRGWAIYYSALHEPRPGSVGGGFSVERVTGDLQRLVPGASFSGLLPGQSVEIEYLTSLLTNNSFAPAGAYLVFDEAKDRGHALRDFVAIPFERPAQGPGRDPRVVSPEQQYALDAVIRDIPVGELAPVFPTPLGVTKGEGELRFAAMPKVEAAAELSAEAAFASEYLRPYFGKSAGPAASVVRLETGRIEGQSSPEAYELVVDPKQGLRIVGASPAGVFYGLQSLRSLLPAPAPGKGLALPALAVVDAPRFGYRGFMLDVARNFQPKALVLRTLDLLARYKINVFHIHLTEDEGWRVEIPSLPELTAVGARRGHTLDSSRFLPPAWGSGPGRGPAVGERLLHARRLRRDPALRRGAAHRGDPRAGDARPRARRDQGHGSALPGAQRGG